MTDGEQQGMEDQNQDMGDADEGGGEKSEIPEDLQEAGVTDPQVYASLKEMGITDAKTYKVAQQVQSATAHRAQEYWQAEMEKAKKQHEEHKVEPAPTPPVGQEDPMGVLRKPLMDALGGEFRKLEKDFKAGKIKQEEILETMITRAVEKTYDHVLDHAVRIGQTMYKGELSKVQQAQDARDAADFFTDHPEYLDFAEPIMIEMNAQVSAAEPKPLGDILKKYDKIIAKSGGNGDRRQPSTEDQKTAQLAQARVHVEGHTGNPQGRGYPASGTPTGKAAIEKAIDEFAKARLAAQSGDPKAVANLNRVAKRWQMARRQAG